MTGRRYGRLTVVRRDEAITGKAAWVCQCDCGRSSTVQGFRLRSGRTRSCGCLRGDAIRKRAKQRHKEFWDRLTRCADGCWVWQGSRLKTGYGTLSVDGRGWRAHRLAYTLAVGPIPQGLKVLHKCDNPPCCNPDHLWLGTQGDNIRDMNVKGRARGAPGLANVKAKFSVEQVTEIRCRYESGGVSRAQLGRDYQLGWSTINRIVRRESYADI